jgi:hypothetical protein
MKLPFLAIVALLAAGAANAQVYKCVDASGKTVYSQNPCPANTKSESMSHSVIAPSAAAPAASAAGAAPAGDAAKAATSSAPKTAAEQEQAFRKRMQDQSEADKKEAAKLAQAKDKQENCQRARTQLGQMTAGGRITRTNEAGERYFLSDDQIAQERGRAQSQVDQWCN